MYLKVTNDGCLISGDFLDNNKPISKWNFHIPNSTIPRPCKIFNSNNGNDVKILTEITPNNMTIITSNLPKFIQDGNFTTFYILIFSQFIYFNLIGRTSEMLAANIISTDPPFNSTIQLRTNLLKIKYAVTILPSTKNITIFQTNGTMRQTISGQLCSVDNDTISVTVLPSTFNSPHSEYYVSIDSNFVKQIDTDEPIFGLDSFNWKLYTGGSIYLIYLYIIHIFTYI